MKKKNRIWHCLLISMGFVLILSNSCKKDDKKNDSTPVPTPTTITDIDGNVYHTVTIGTQVWLVENLKVTRYRNGDSIPNITNNTQWGNLTIGAYGDYDNTPSISATYGKYYNWYAVKDSRNIAPVGWHVATDAEWIKLLSYLGNEYVAGGKLKEADTTHWLSPNTGATNETGFTALPGGFRYTDGKSYYIGSFGYWWGTTEYDTDNVYGWMMDSESSIVGSFPCTKAHGMSVRCVRD